MRHLIVFLHSVHLIYCSSGSSTDRLLDRFVQMTAENCQGGAADNVINVKLNYGKWEEITANIMDQAGIFASSVTSIPGLHPRNRLRAPYSHKVGGGMKEINIGDNYDYTSTETPYWDEPSSGNDDNVRTVEVNRELKNSKSKQILPVATWPDGRWTLPYFDCGGRNVWLTTHTSPILCKHCKRNKNTLKGVGHIDIDLSSKDINQCSYEDSRSNKRDAFNDLFRGTNRCQETTRCRPKSGVGLKRGGYVCVCKRGYYMPRGYKAAFYGVDIENAYKANKNLSKFNCIRYRRRRRNKFNKWYRKRGYPGRKLNRRIDYTPAGAPGGFADVRVLIK